MSHDARLLSAGFRDRDDSAEPVVEVAPTGVARLTTAQVDVQNFALITHTIPAQRLRRAVPERFELQTFVDEAGREMGFISASSFCNRQIHWSAARYPAHDFDQSTFRTYVTHRGRLASYFFATYVGTHLSLVGQKVVAADTQIAQYDVEIDMDETGYHRYSCWARTDTEELRFELEATDPPTAKFPFKTGDEHAQFITYRLHGYAVPLVGGVTYGPIEHRHMEPWEGRLLNGRFDLWERLGLLPREEWATPYSVLVEPSVRFTLHPPRPAGPP